MATELGRFLSGQLANLPANHPDRAFLEDTERLTESYINKPKENPLSCLTPREKEVLGLIAQGFSNGKIAETLGLNTRGVESHIQKIYRQLGVSSKNSKFGPRVQTALCYIENTPSFENPVERYFGGNEIASLTRRQKAIVRYVGQGYTNQAIADFLTISRNAVEGHINRILSEKLLVDHETHDSRVMLALVSQTRHAI